MEVVVGGEEPVSHDRAYDSTALSKDFMPVAWAAAYGQHITNPNPIRSFTFVSTTVISVCTRVNHTFLCVCENQVRLTTRVVRIATVRRAHCFTSTSRMHWTN